MHKIDYIDRIDGLYWFCADFHSGQYSFLYSVLSRLSRIYKPSILAKGPSSDSAKTFYLNLCERNISNDLWE